MDPETCKYCGKELPLIRFVTRMLAGPCDCVQAMAEREEAKRREEEAIRQERLARLFKLSLLPDRWTTRRFASYQLTDKNRSAFDKAKDYAEHFDPKAGRGLIFTGTVGTGKTHLAAATAMELIERGQRVVFGTIATLLGQIRSTYDTDKRNERDVFDRMTRCDLLIIDDLGKEKVTEWVDQTVYELINTRYEANKALIITTNMRLADIRAKYSNTGEAIVSRVMEMCEGIKMDGPDWRKKAVQ